MDYELKDKVVIVTGGANGIGEDITRTLAGEGAMPVIFDKDREAGEGMNRFLKEHHYNGILNRFYRLDLRDVDLCKKSIESVINTYSGIDILINNAGNNDGRGLDASVDEFRESLENNLVHNFTMTKYCWPHLVESKGNIVNIGSAIGFTGEGDNCGYVAAKAGVHALTRAYAIKGLDVGVRSNAVIPSTVDTPLLREWAAGQEDGEEIIQKLAESIPLGKRITTPEEIANTVLFLASNKISSHTTGQYVFVDGGDVHLDRRVGMI